MPLTVVIIIGMIIIGVIVGLDIYLAIDKHDNNTWSEIIRHFATVTPVIPFICGVLSGHFFSWRDHSILVQPGGIAVLIWSACVIGIIGLSLARGGGNIPLFVVFAIAFIVGALFWPCT